MITKQFLLACMAIGILAGGVYNEAYATNAPTEKATENQQRQECVLTREKTKELIENMKKSDKPTELVIPDGYTLIGWNAFEECTGLTSITIPDSVMHIFEDVFDGFNNELIFYVPSESMAIYLVDICRINRDKIKVYQNRSPDAWFWYPDANGKIEIPNNITEIESQMFFRRNDIRSVSIPDGVTKIKQWAFRWCKELTSVKIPDSLTEIGFEAFERCTKLTSINVPNNVTKIAAYAFAGCEGLTSITIPNNVESIECCTFSECTGLTSITIPNSVSTIEECAFFECTGLTSITIPNSVKSIGFRAFWGCTGLTSVTIQDGVTKIGFEAFYKCTGLTSIIIPDSVTLIGKRAFKGCRKLEHIYVYSDRVKQLVIDSESDINPDIIEVIKKPENEQK